MNSKAIALLGLSLLWITPWASAENSLSDYAMSERFYVSFGGYNVFRADSSISLVDSDLGAGVALSPTDTLGLDIETTVLKLDGYYRLSPTGKIGFSWYRIDTESSKRLESSVDWVNPDGEQITIAAGSQMESSLIYDVMKLGYYWSFYHNEKVELSAGGGFHISRFQVDLDVETDSNGNPVSQDSGNVAQTLPLPTVGIGVNYRVNPDLYWYLSAEGFYLTYDDWDGSYTEVQLGLEYAVLDHVGVGIAFVGNSLNASEDTPEYKLKYHNQFNGVNFYVSWFM
ncbi:hypothetical protein [Ketobacter sp.]|uniref:hypothetical protein n=1 Tax=Ketobacter sp. TaxID=2083498 RepID=UPI000F28A31A|nr:hypothetical protein [Ketobacter sp.]RLT93977.1 MAG: hypothetical protein D9N14_17590 [Ketobacter sp.]